MEVEKAEFGGALRCAYCALPAIIAWNGLGANKQPDDQKARRTRSFRTGAQSAPAEGRFWPSMYWRRTVTGAPPTDPTK
jgi:hypothetical protein